MQNTQHPDDAAVDALATAMKAKLAKQRAKGYGGWDDKVQCSQQFLSALLRRHVDKGDPVDVANFCAFLLARGEGITAQGAPLPLLLRDIARDLGITVPQACIALKPLGNYSTNSAVTAEMARMLRDHFPAPAHPAEGVPAQAEPFMWAIQEPGGSAYMDKNCVSTSRGIVEAEVDGLNLGLDADDEPYKVVPVYLAATKPAQAVPSDDDAFQAAIDMLHSARVELDLLREALNVPVEPHQSLFERVLDAAKATHPTQQGMDAIAALQKVRDIAVSALLTGSLDRQDWIDDMDRIAAQAKQGGAA